MGDDFMDNSGPGWLDGAIVMGPMAEKIAGEKHGQRRIECALFAEDGACPY